MSGNRKGSITESISSTARPEDELIKAYSEVIFLYTEIDRTNEASVCTCLRFLQKGPSAILGTGCSTTRCFSNNMPYFL